MSLPQDHSTDSPQVVKAKENATNSMKFLVRAHWSKSSILEEGKRYDESLANYDKLLTYVEQKFGTPTHPVYIETSTKRTMTYFKYVR